MARSQTPLRTFNRGLISPLALARTDIDRVSLSAETMTNWMPRVLGSMMLRPGTQYIGATASNNAAKFIPFVYSTTDTALIEFTPLLMRVWVSDALVTRTTVTASISNGTFTTNLNGWTTVAGGGAAGHITGDYLGLYGDGTTPAQCYQSVTLNETGVEHAIGIGIERGPVTLKVGTALDDDSYIATTVLGTGTHSLTFTPTTDFVIEFQSATKYEVLVSSIGIAAAGVMTLVSPYAGADLSKIRWDQSADVVYLAADGYQQYKIERRSTTSWSLVKYEPTDGPFRGINITKTTLTANALSGGTEASPVTLTSPLPLFKTTDVGALFRLSSNGQTVTQVGVTAENTFTTAIRVTGVTNSRVFSYTVTGVSDSTVTLQRSLIGPDSGFTDVGTPITAPDSATYDDKLDNQIAWYRIGIKTGGYGTDTVTFTLDFPNGSIEGIGKVISVTSNKVVNVSVLVDFGDTDATTDWYEGDWSSTRGYPTAVALVEGRLGWAGRDRVWLSVSDAYESFDDTVIGDSGTIRRTIGTGPVDNVNWMVALKRLLYGTDSTEWALRSSGEDEILTPTNANPKPYGTQGSATVNPVKIDGSALFVQRGGTRLMESSLNATDFEFGLNNLTGLYPEAGNAEFVRLAVQRQPDTRVHCVRGDGVVSVLVHDAVEEVSCWTAMESGDGSETVLENSTSLGWGEAITSVVSGGSTQVYGTFAYATKTFATPAFTVFAGGMFLNSDGTKWYVAVAPGGAGQVVEQHTLSTPYDISTAVLGDSVDITGQTTTSAQISFNTDGTILHVLESTGAGNSIWQYTLTSGFDLTTASYATKTFDFSGTDTNQRSFDWNGDGTRLILLGGYSAVPALFQFTASVAWDVTTLVYDSVTFVLPDIPGTYAATVFTGHMNASGTTYYAIQTQGSQRMMAWYNLSTAWDISTATFLKAEALVDPFVAPATNYLDFCFSVDETTFFLSAANASPFDCYQYTQGLVSTSVNDSINYTDFSTFSSSAAEYSTVNVEDVVVLPGTVGASEDQVYYLVNRDVSGGTVRYLEKWALESECLGGTTNKCADSHVIGTITGGVMTGLTHLEGKEVAVWVNGKDIGRYTVASGQITGLTEDGSNACAGISYTARYKSVKLGDLTEKKREVRLGVILKDAHYQGLLYGTDFGGGNLEPLPLIESGAITAADTVHATYDQESFSLPGVWETDARLCLQSQSPRPVTVLAAIIETEG